MKPIIKPEKVAGEWGLRLSIGNQSFTIRTFSETKKDTLWHKQMLEVALGNIQKK